MRMLNQIISKGLHNTDAECLQFTTTLMEKLEQTKADNSTNDAVVDNAAGKAYVEQFALEVFQRAENAVQANKVSKQTAETYQAAAVFLEVLKEWGELESDIQAKIKWAKWNAVRIVKEIKEGKDPNESNPKSEPTPEEGLLALDPNDPDVLPLGGAQNPSRQPTVEDVPDEGDQVQSHLASQSVHDQSLHQSNQHSPEISPASGGQFYPYPKDGFPYNIATGKSPDISPLESPQAGKVSLGGGYFPSVPTFTSHPGASKLPTTPSEVMIDINLTPELVDSTNLIPPGTSANIKDDEEIPQAPPVPPSAQDFYRQNTPHRQINSPSPVAPPYNPVEPRGFSHPPPQTPQYEGQFNYQPPHRQVPPSATYEHQFPPQPSHPQQQTPLLRPTTGKQVLKTDEEAIAKAQKHARWAISALNFEDAETAVKELRAALVTLGASQ